MTGTQSACLLIFGLFGAFLGVWVYLKPVEALEMLWPEPEPDLPSLPEPRFAWRRKAYLGGEVVSPLFHHPRAAGRWAAERGESAESLTFVEVVDGIAYRAERHDAIVAIVESADRQRGLV